MESICLMNCRARDWERAVVRMQLIADARRLNAVMATDQTKQSPQPPAMAGNAAPEIA
jgi:hypothetical protein